MLSIVVPIAALSPMTSLTSNLLKLSVAGEMALMRTLDRRILNRSPSSALETSLIRRRNAKCPRQRDNSGLARITTCFSMRLAPSMEAMSKKPSSKWPRPHWNEMPSRPSQCHKLWWRHLAAWSSSLRTTVRGVPHRPNLTAADHWSSSSPSKYVKVHVKHQRKQLQR